MGMEDLRPQSNQRGIETACWASSDKGACAPQSNQRGIETDDGSSPPQAADEGLNRTSVGLKPFSAKVDGVEMGGPQSNQRGIETALVGAYLVSWVVASIEPAWD